VALTEKILGPTIPFVNPHSMALQPEDLELAIARLERGDWQGAHAIVQKDEDSALACWAHGIVHLMERDAANARYWYREARRDFTGAGGVAGEISALKSASGIGRAKK
jgi:hypothetical protein